MDAEIVYRGRVVGKVRADGYFEKQLQFSRHLLQKPKPSIAINLDVLDAAEQKGAHTCEVIDTESGEHYRAQISIIRVRGFRVNRGMGLQIALPLSEWKTDQTNSAPETPPSPAQLKQLSLW